MKTVNSQQHGGLGTNVAIVLGAVAAGIVGVMVFIFLTKPTVREYFFPADITYNDARVVPLKDELAKWESSLVDAQWTVIPGRAPSPDDLTLSSLEQPSDFEFPRSDAKDPFVDGWLSTLDNGYYVHVTWSRYWKPLFNTPEKFEAWAKGKFPKGKFACDKTEPFKCSIQSEGYSSDGRQYLISFNALHSNNFLLDNKGPHTFFILQKQSRG